MNDNYKKDTGMTSSALQIKTMEKQLNIGKVGGVLDVMPVKPEAVLAYTPDYCGFVEWRDNGFAAFDDNASFRASDIFELRCFCRDYELHWVCEGGSDEGRAALISEKNLDVAGFVRETSEDELFFKLENRYML